MWYCDYYIHSEIPILVYRPQWQTWRLIILSIFMSHRTNKVRKVRALCFLLLARRSFRFVKTFPIILHLVSFSLSCSCFRDFLRNRRPKYHVQQTFSRWNVQIQVLVLSSPNLFSFMFFSFNTCENLRFLLKSEILPAEWKSRCYG